MKNILKIALASILAVLFASLVLPPIPSAQAGAPPLGPGAPAVKLLGRRPDGQFAPVNVDSQGNLMYAPTTSTCANWTPQKLEFVGLAAVTIPASTLPNRRYFRVCNSPENLNNPLVKCLLGGGTPVMGMAVTEVGVPDGDVIQIGLCFEYALPAEATMKCVSDNANTGVITFQCAS
jgi:hypothetical protein